MAQVAHRRVVLVLRLGVLVVDVLSLRVQERHLGHPRVELDARLLVLQPDYLLVRDHGLLRLDLHLHVVLEQGLVLAIVAYPFPGCAHLPLLPEMVEADRVLAEATVLFDAYQSFRFVSLKKGILQTPQCVAYFSSTLDPHDTYDCLLHLAHAVQVGRLDCECLVGGPVLLLGVALLVFRRR